MKMHVSMMCAVAWLAAGTCAWAQNWTGTKLNDLAVTSNGVIFVLGTEGSYDNNGRTKETVFDGQTATYFDPPKATASVEPCWAGFQLPAPKMVTRIRYFGRGGYPHRMRGCLFQGADDATFTDPVTLHVANPPAGWLGTNAWVDVTLNTTNAFRTFSYLRILGPTVYTVAGSPAEDGTYAGNAAEVEFYGADLTLDELPPPPVMVFSNAVNWRANLKWDVATNSLMYEVQRRLAREAEFTTVMLDCFKNTNDAPRIWADPLFLTDGADYRIRAINNIGDSGWVDIPLQPLNAASGTWFGSPGSYNNNGMTGDKLYDGDIATFFDGPNTPGDPPFWSALDLGKARDITGLRFIPRATFQDRMAGGIFEAANTTNFSDAVALHTITSNPSYDTMTEVTLPSVAAGYRYVRYSTPFSKRCNALEIEFLLAPHEPRAPVGLAVAPSDITNAYAVLSWNPGDRNLVSSSIVHRATAPGGPYTAQTPEGVPSLTWTDTTAQVGVLYYYKVSALYAAGATVYEGPLSEYITYRRAERLERTWNDNMQLRANVTAFRIGTPWGNNASVDVDKLFDGNIGTYADISPANGVCAVGVDFGEPCGITGVRFVPRATFDYRVNGAVLCGSNDLSAATVLATFSGAKYDAYTWISATDTNTYRYVYATRTSGDFLGNFTELEFYGWRAASAADVLTAPASVTFTPQAPASLLVSWTAGDNATSYRVERATAAQPDIWTEVGTDAALSLADTAPVMHTPSLYRVVALRGVEEAYSNPFPFIPYAPGNGTGLRGHYTSGFTKAYDPSETFRLKRVDAGIDFSWGTSPIIPDVPESATNVLVIWNGKLIAPVTGAYIFRATTDDGIALRINGAFVINEWNATGTRSSAPVLLEEGQQYDIRMDYFQAGGNAYAHLEWDGAVTRGIIPAAQLTPADLPSEDIGLWRGRTFNAPRLGTHTVDTATGGIKISSGGMDFNGPNEGNHLVWQPVSGAFLLEAKIVLSLEGDTSAKAMLVMRNELASGCPVLAAARIGQTPGKYGVKRRLEKGLQIVDILSPAWQGDVSNPFWLRLKRLGKTTTMEIRNDGGDWVNFYTYEDTGSVFNSSVIVGLGVTSPSAGNTGSLPNAVFSDIRLLPLSGTVLILR